MKKSEITISSFIAANFADHSNIEILEDYITFLTTVKGLSLTRNKRGIIKQAKEMYNLLNNDLSDLNENIAIKWSKDGHARITKSIYQNGEYIEINEFAGGGGYCKESAVLTYFLDKLLAPALYQQRSKILADLQANKDDKYQQHIVFSFKCLPHVFIPILGTAGAGVSMVQAACKYLGFKLQRVYTDKTIDIYNISVIK